MNKTLKRETSTHPLFIKKGGNKTIFRTHSLVDRPYAIIKRICKSGDVLDITIERVQYIAHHLHSFSCPHCHTVTEGTFPCHISQKIQYGPRIIAYVAYLSIYHLIPFKRLTQILYDLHGCHISQGIVINMVDRISSNLEKFTDYIRVLLIVSPVIHNDETGMKVVKARFWLHVVSAKKWTLYGIFRREGVKI